MPFGRYPGGRRGLKGRSKARMFRRGRGGFRRSSALVNARRINSLSSAAVRPDRLIVKLPYSENIVLSTGTNGQGMTYTWNLNSIYDPNRTGTGHQPLGYDQWATFYAKYKVFKVAYELTATSTWVNDTGETDAGTQCGVLATNGVAAGTFTDGSFYEQPHTQKFSLGAAAGQGSKTVRKTIDLSLITGRPKVAYLSDPRYEANFGYNPAEAMTLTFGAQPNWSGQNLNMALSIKIIYYVELFDPLILSLSNTAPEARGGPDGQTETAVGVSVVP